MSGKRAYAPQRVILLGFAAAIAAGALLLSLPIAVRDKPLSLIDALFTATSAVCVTGLVVVDTADTFTLFGRTVIALLIQIGGLGVATLSTFTALLIGRRIGLKERILLQEALNRSDLEGLVRLLRYVILTTLVIEAIGALLLTALWTPSAGLLRALGWGAFHAISAFNNAGFDLSGAFASLSGQPAGVLWVIGVLIVLGGLGFVVIADLQQNGLRWRRWSYQTRIVALSSAALIVFGTAVLAAAEAGRAETWGGLNWWSQLGHAAFQSIAARTAGFASIDIGRLQHASLLIIMLLMFIGASPNSTGGGIKTTTFVVLLTAVRATLTRRADPSALGHRLSSDTVHRAIALTFLAATVVTFGSGLLLIAEPQISFEAAAFEVISAFSTAGLSTGITTGLSIPAKLILVMIMFLGRAGLLTFVVAIARPAAEPFRLPESKLPIG
ncbi:MAG TPA: potassium transporter TrkG [Limnochordia bacterium]